MAVVEIKNAMLGFDCVRNRNWKSSIQQLCRFVLLGAARFVHLVAFGIDYSVCLHKSHFRRFQQCIFAKMKERNFWIFFLGESDERCLAALLGRMRMLSERFRFGILKNSQASTTSTSTVIDDAIKTHDLERYSSMSYF